jgi:hypothetical protein
MSVPPLESSEMFGQIGERVAVGPLAGKMAAPAPGAYQQRGW